MTREETMNHPYITSTYKTNLEYVLYAKRPD
jgi:hypothetical protein